MFISNEKDLKALASGLRRELKAMGVTHVSHNQMLEALAKGMGHSSFAALRATTPGTSLPVTAPGNLDGCPSPGQPTRVWGFVGEKAHIAELTKYKAYRLLNADGQLDLASEGELVRGLWLSKVVGTSDDIRNCTAHINGACRASNGELQPAYAGETTVNWDAQTVRKDTRGVELYLTEGGDEVPADGLVVAPELDEADDEDGVLNLLNEEVSQTLRVRDSLVDSCRRWLVDNRLVLQALKEMDWDEEWDGFGAGFAESADAIGEPGSKDASALGQAQWVAGFALHVREFKALREQLLNSQTDRL